VAEEVKIKECANFDLFDSVEECAAVAAPRFREQRWRWAGKGIPDEAMIADSLRALAQTKSKYAESGRLIYCDGRYGVQTLRPDLPHPWVRNQPQ
jgi:hypothetical protein